ncbi:galactose-specific lectin nattectin-like [Dunckerocampus dactyliophorus]|uniref:galactose-specific lectin nattectin-like n=1 Tax=Dunckerocampus dactyliophorus TaxID=161453 RepID=UPI0024070F99|nr:galactose-specific lectin nattectin-like [Dunckerocampus dactyliophorus]
MINKFEKCQYQIWYRSTLLTKSNNCAADKKCPDGWTQLNNHCYVYQSDNRTFVDAEQACNDLGGNLASICDDLANTLVTQVILEAGGLGSLTWIGLHEAFEEGDFFWTDGSISDFRNFATGQPNDDSGNEECVQIQPSDGLWSDADCTDEIPSVCIRDICSDVQTPVMLP